MKKFFISLSALLAIAIASPAISSARSADDNCPATTACVNGGKKDKKHRHGECDRQHCYNDTACRRGGDGRFAAFLFDGIQLTDAQKADIKVLRDRLKTERKNYDDATKARAKADKRQMREESKKKYDEGMKSILSKDQYAKYQENKAKMEAQRKAARQNKSDKAARRHNHHNHHNCKAS